MAHYKNLYLRMYVFLCILYVSCTQINKETETLANQIKITSPNLENLKVLISSSDTILLVSHDKTYGPIFDKNNLDTVVLAQPIVLNNTINRKLIHESRIIKGDSLKKLIAIITRPINGDPISVATCFDPHHAFILIHNQQKSFIDLCFTCGGAATSDDIIFSFKDCDKNKWDELYNFIKNQGIKYML